MTPPPRRATLGRTRTHARARRSATPCALRVATLQTLRARAVRTARVPTTNVRARPAPSVRIVKQARRPWIRARGRR